MLVLTCLTPPLGAKYRSFAASIERFRRGESAAAGQSWSSEPFLALCYVRTGGR